MKKRRSDQMAEEKKELPEDLMTEIALRLPMKSIGQLKCVSKEWNLFLSSPEFVKSHLHRAPDHQRIILVPESDQTPHVIAPATDGGGGGRPRAVKSRLLKDGWKTELLGCCNGLVLLKVKKTNGRFSFVVINPVTSRATKVPTSALPDHVGKAASFGLGYDRVDDDYKIVVMINDHKNIRQKLPKLTDMNIFSLKTRSCKKSADSRFRPCSNHRHGVYVNNRLHWVAYKDNGKYVIVAFDLSTEKFEEAVSPPSGFDHRFYELSVIGGCLAITETSMPINVLIMENLGYYWRKFTIAKYDVVCRLGGFEFMLAKNNKEAVAGVWRERGIDGLSKARPESIRMMTFRESLLCPSHMFKGFNH